MSGLYQQKIKNWPIRDSAIEVVSNEINKGLKSSLKEHTSWWDDYWAKSYIEIPDTLLEKQYYLEMNLNSLLKTLVLQQTQF